MVGAAIVFVIAVSFLIWVYKTFKEHEKNAEQIKYRIANDPKYIAEKNIKNHFDSIELKSSYPFRYISVDYGDKYAIAEENNDSVLADFIKKGALIVASKNLANPRTRFKNIVGLYVVGPRLTFYKSDNDGAKLNDICGTGAGFGVMSSYVVSGVTNKKADVGKAAAAGAVLGGVGGAVIGASIAKSKNDAGGTNKVVYNDQKSYFIGYFQTYVDHIMISKKAPVSTPPPSKYISRETKDCWILDSCLIGTCADDLNPLVNYLNNII